MGNIPSVPEFPRISTDCGFPSHPLPRAPVACAPGRQRVGERDSFVGSLPQEPSPTHSAAGRPVPSLRESKVIPPPTRHCRAGL